MNTDLQIARMHAMKWFLVFSVLYMTFAIVLSAWALPPNKDPIITLILTGKRLLPKVQLLVIAIAALGAVAYLFQRKWALGSIIKLTVMGVIAGVLFQTAFTLTKASLPWIVPFYADPFFAKIDAALHFGHDPYVLTHKLAAFVEPVQVSNFYFRIWGPLAGFLPVLLCIADRDPVRMRRTLILFGVAWILFGNVFAIMGMSVGPVYYDRIYGVERFEELRLALAASGLADGGVGWVQNMLWNVHNSDLDFVGPGISAFPSVHVSVATLFAIYLAERSKVLAPVGFAYLGVILFLSVYTGFHYAIDGYFSIIVMVGVWAMLKRVNLAPRAARQPAQGFGEAALG